MNMVRERIQPSPFAPQLDLASGVPAYRQIIDQVLGATASGTLLGGDQLPTVRQLAVDLSINPNTVVRAYRELEIRGILTTQQGIGTERRQGIPLLLRSSLAALSLGVLGGRVADRDRRDRRRQHHRRVRCVTAPHQCRSLHGE